MRFKLMKEQYLGHESERYEWIFLDTVLYVSIISQHSYKP